VVLNICTQKKKNVSVHTMARFMQRLGLILACFTSSQAFLSSGTVYPLRQISVSASFRFRSLLLFSFERDYFVLSCSFFCSLLFLAGQLTLCPVLHGAPFPRLRGGAGTASLSMTDGVKRVLVTGANKGIGLATVEKLLCDYPEVA